MTTPASKLLQPITVGPLELKNRIMFPPLTTGYEERDGSIGERSLAFYERLARGGVSYIVIGDVAPVMTASPTPKLATDAQIPTFKALADAVHKHGAKVALQLFHPEYDVPGVGRMVMGSMAAAKAAQEAKAAGDEETFAAKMAESNEIRKQAYAKLHHDMQHFVNEASVEQLTQIKEAIAASAARAQQAGIDAIEVHGDRLVGSLCSAILNQRTDEYGGCLENRCRFAIEVLKAVREAVGPRFPIEFRMSGSELFEGGYDLEEGCRIAQQIEPYIDLLHVSAGTYQRGFGDTHPSMFKEHGCNVYLAAEIKKHVKVPVATIGGLNDPAQMEEIIASGKADIVYMARALLADPFLPNKVMSNRGDEIVRCLRCFTCMAERAATSTRRCTVNPLIGRELEGDTIYPAPEKKKVLVAGGGPGGLYAAYTAARRGHQVILCEKDAELGGILKSEQALPFKQEMYQLAGTYANLARKAGVEIRLNTAVTPELVAAEAPDALIIAVGSAPLVPPIPGLKGDNVVVVNNYYKEKDKVTDDVVVFGGGLAGCECAIHLGQEGKRVHLVEMRDVLAPDANVRHRPLLLKEIEKYVTVHTGCKGLEVRPDGILCETKDGEQVLVPGTSVICALGQRSRTADVEALRGTAPFVRIIGDAAKVSTITNAVYWGYHAALDIGAGMD